MMDVDIYCIILFSVSLMVNNSHWLFDILLLYAFEYGPNATGLRRFVIKFLFIGNCIDIMHGSWCMIFKKLFDLLEGNKCCSYIVDEYDKDEIDLLMMMMIITSNICFMHFFICYDNVELLECNMCGKS